MLLNRLGYLSSQLWNECTRNRFETPVEKRSSCGHRIRQSLCGKKAALYITDREVLTGLIICTSLIVVYIVSWGWLEPVFPLPLESLRKLLQQENGRVDESTVRNFTLKFENGDVYDAAGQFFWRRIFLRALVKVLQLPFLQLCHKIVLFWEEEIFFNFLGGFFAIWVMIFERLLVDLPLFYQFSGCFKGVSIISSLLASLECLSGRAKNPKKCIVHRVAKRLYTSHPCYIP